MTGIARLSAKGAASPLSLVAPAPSQEDRLLPATRESYREAMRQLAGAVSVVTFGRDAERAGLTATSIVSLSADPPTLLFCIQRSSSAYDALAAANAFAVNVLAADQQEFAESFSGSGGLKGGDRYHGREWRELPSGVFALSSAMCAWAMAAARCFTGAAPTISSDGAARNLSAPSAFVRAGRADGGERSAQAGGDRTGWERRVSRRVAG
jgi:hypothetical protein